MKRIAIKLQQDFEGIETTHLVDISNTGSVLLGTPISHKLFKGMSAKMQNKLLEQGVHSVEQLAEMSPKQIDTLPIEGLGETYAKRWHITAKEILK